MYLPSSQDTSPEECLPAASPVGDVERFIQLLHTACDNRAIHKALERLLSQPTEQRQALVHAWVSDMRANQASREFVHAVASLTEDGVADRAYATIFRRPRGSLLASLRPPR